MTPRARILVISAVVLAIAALVAAARVGGTNTGRCPNQPAEIERVSPSCGAAALQRDPVEVDLAPGYEGELLINDFAVPVERVAALNLLRYRPAPGREIERLPAQTNVATAIYWRADLGRDQAKRFTWAFRVT